jgi:hypothetical protein
MTLRRTPNIATGWACAGRLRGSVLAPLLALVVVSLARADQPADPFADAAIAPADVTIYLHVENAAELRATLAERPMGRLLEHLIRRGELDAAWEKAAALAGIDGATLFDRWLGRRFTLLVRPEAEGADWVVLTEVREKDARDTLRPLKPRRRAPRYGRPVMEFPESDVVIAAVDDRFVIGPKRPGRLLAEMLPRVAGEEPPTESLAEVEAEAIDKARALGAGTTGLYLRHGGFLGGWSVAVASVDGEHVKLCHAARFEHPPFDRPLTELRWNAAPLQALEDEALLVMMEPTDIGFGPVENFTHTVLKRRLLSEEMREQLGETRIITVGEIEGRQEPEPVDLLLPAGSVAIEISNENTQRAVEMIDAQLVQVAHALADMGKGAFDLDVPATTSLKDGHARHVDLRPAIEHLGGGFPIMRSVSLNWSVAKRPDRSYYVIATHPQHLGEIVEALEQTETGPECRGPWTSCGSLDGTRVAVHLQSFVDQAGLLVPDDEGDAEAFREAMVVLSRLAEGMNRCRWRLARPQVETMRLEVDIELSRPASAAPVH